jgi:hypothetical protein
MKMMISSMHYCFGFPNIFVFFPNIFSIFHLELPLMAFNCALFIFIWYACDGIQHIFWNHVQYKQHTKGTPCWYACNGLDIFSLNQTFRYACVTKGTDFAHMYSSSSEKRYRLHVFQVKWKKGTGHVDAYDDIQLCLHISVLLQMDTQGQQIHSKTWNYIRINILHLQTELD